MNLKIGKSFKKVSLRRQLGLAEIPLMIGLLIMAVAVPVATKLTQNNADNRGSAKEVECNASADCGKNYTCKNHKCVKNAVTKAPTKPPAKPSSKTPTKPPSDGCKANRCQGDKIQYCDTSTGNYSTAYACVNGKCVSGKCVSNYVPPTAAPTKDCTCVNQATRCTTEVWTNACGQRCQGQKNCATPTKDCTCVNQATRCTTEVWTNACGQRCQGQKNCATPTPISTSKKTLKDGTFCVLTNNIAAYATQGCNLCINGHHVKGSQGVCGPAPTPTSTSKKTLKDGTFCVLTNNIAAYATQGCNLCINGHHVKGSQGVCGPAPTPTKVPIVTSGPRCTEQAGGKGKCMSSCPSNSVSLGSFWDCKQYDDMGTLVKTNPCCGPTPTPAPVLSCCCSNQSSANCVWKMTVNKSCGYGYEWRTDTTCTNIPKPTTVQKYTCNPVTGCKADANGAYTDYDQCDKNCHPNTYTCPSASTNCKAGNSCYALGLKSQSGTCPGGQVCCGAKLTATNTPTPAVARYACTSSKTCVPDSSGPFRSVSECSESCKKPTPTPVKGSCYVAEKGGYVTSGSKWCHTISTKVYAKECVNGSSTMKECPGGCSNGNCLAQTQYCYCKVGDYDTCAWGFSAPGSGYHRVEAQFCQGIPTVKVTPTDSMSDPYGCYCPSSSCSGGCWMGSSGPARCSLSKCSASTKICDPGAYKCDGAMLVKCNSEGKRWDYVKDCVRTDWCNAAKKTCDGSSPFPTSGGPIPTSGTGPTSKPPSGGSGCSGSAPADICKPELLSIKAQCYNNKWDYDDQECGTANACSRTEVCGGKTYYCGKDGKWSTTNTCQTSACQQCQSDFGCYKNGSEYKWFVSNMVGGGFTKVADSECTGHSVAKPAYLGKQKGDANCDGKIDVDDFSQWHKEYYDGGKGASSKTTWAADFTGPAGKCDGKVDVDDFSLWHKYYYELKGNN